MKVTLIIGILFCGVFVVSVGVGVVQFVHEQAFLSKAELVTGTITGNQVDSSGNRVEFCPIIEFTTKAGEPVSYEGAICANHPDQIQVGQQVQVYYDPQNTNNIQTSRGSLFSQYADTAGFPFFFGLLFLVIAAIMIAVVVWGTVSEHQKARQTAAYMGGSQDWREQRSQPTMGTGETEASLLAQEERLKAQQEQLKAMDEELKRKIEGRRRQQGQ